jgi:cytochrome P450
LGASLARTEAEVALRRLTQLPDLKLAAEPEWRQTQTLRGLNRLPIRFAA